ncbi:MAG: tRNA 2-thiouridine(34) synthase MnmA [Prevotella sp.]|nr:tRNA 2-thiouridine(34) synthase MnmA [Prevotella sp.]
MKTEEIKNKRVALLLSGGVDSAVALHELVSQGVKPDCFYIMISPTDSRLSPRPLPVREGSNYPQGVQEERLSTPLPDREGQGEGSSAWDCSMEEDLEMATALARRYGVTLEVVDCHRDYWDEVTRYTMESVRAGRTPNPDVMCNRLIKFGAFDRKRGHDYDLIATGHYAQTEIDGEGRKWLCTSPDPVKDQTDFLAQLYDWQLGKALFPIGHMRKEEVRAIAEREHLVNARRKDSQGICFLGKISYNDYLRRYLGEQEGDVVDLETGKVLGRHKGHWFHTIGQRKGLGLGGGPWNVVKKDVEQNILYVVRGYEPIKAHRKEFVIKDFHWLGAPPHGLSSITFKVRHTPDYFIGTADDLGNGSYRMHADRWVQGVAPGQFCVVYDRDFHRCLGSGEITV